MPLPPLERLTLLPDQYGDRSRALSLLRRIESIEINEVVKRNGSRHYAVDIYYKLTKHRIPSVRSKTTRKRGSSQTHQSDVRVLRRFSEFGNLCDEIYFHTHTGHEMFPCEFCATYTKYTTVSPTQPRLVMKILHGDDQVRRLLERFLNDVLRMTVSGVKAFGGRDCLGQEHAPLLLLEFLLPHEASPLGSLAAEMSVQAVRDAVEAQSRADAALSTLSV